ncbi:MAG: hypothetical protein Q9166_007202 [cf. Caloplaca sp. 2 TL-2023]
MPQDHLARDIHKLCEVIDPEKVEEWKRKDIWIRNQQAWSSPVADPATTEVSFRYRANGQYLEFLSLFLNEDRQVDIDFQKRHSFILFLMNSLEESHLKYVKRTIPNEVDILQLFSGDEFEVDKWQSFIRAPHFNLGVSDYMQGKGGELKGFFKEVNEIRQLAVHRTSTYRWNFNTATIMGAAACARSLDDDALLEQIELIVKVLYIDAGGSSGYTVTEEQKKTAYHLLSPRSRQSLTSHQLLDEIQNLAENSSYNFCLRRLPQELQAFNCTVPEHFELSQWKDIIQNRWCSGSSISQENKAFFVDLNHKLVNLDVRHLRNAAAHRKSFEFDPRPVNSEEGCGEEECGEEKPDDGFRQLRGYIKTAAAYVRALEDEETALQMEKLGAEVIPLLRAKYEEWLNPEWCTGKDMKLIVQTLRDRLRQWQGLYSSSDRDNASFIYSRYWSAANRLEILRWKLRKLNGSDPDWDDPTNHFEQEWASTNLDAYRIVNNDIIDDQTGRESPHPEDTFPDFPCDQEDHDSNLDESEASDNRSLDQQEPGTSDAATIASDNATAWDNADITAPGSAADKRVATGDWNNDPIPTTPPSPSRGLDQQDPDTSKASNPVIDSPSPETQQDEPTALDDSDRTTTSPPPETGTATAEETTDNTAPGTEPQLEDEEAPASAEYKQEDSNTQDHTVNPPINPDEESAANTTP